MTTIVFLVLKGAEVQGVFEEEAVANIVKARHPGSIVDAWVLDSRSPNDATVEEFLAARRVVEKEFLEVGDEVFFIDDLVRGVGTISALPNGSEFYRIEVKSGHLYDQVSRGIVRGDTPVFMYREDIKGVLAK